ncbi:MAG: hypothetical protein GC192_05655 [Bacteroidetes bacterium]|nr:hypothetical protein [Bacteroidota bacterium]
MNKEKHRPHCRVRSLALLIITSFLFTTCQNDLENLPTEQAFTKEKLERLGDMLRNELLKQYEVLPQLSPYDTSIYWYLQTMYEQATSSMHLDRQSPVYNKWDQDRKWKVYILKSDDQQLAFTLPGGDFFISTGMLKCLQKDYELYALLSFEAALMNEGYLLAQWTMEYNSLTINNLIEGNDQPNPLTAEVLAEKMTSFVFETKTIEAVDKAAIENTCSTSILDPVGLVPFLGNANFENSKWLQTRPSYDGRVEMLPEMADHFCQNDQLGVGNYQRFVLNVLE